MLKKQHILGEAESADDSIRLTSRGAIACKDLVFLVVLLCAPPRRRRGCLTVAYGYQTSILGKQLWAVSEVLHQLSNSESFMQHIISCVALAVGVLLSSCMWRSASYRTCLFGESRGAVARPRKA